MSVSVSPDLFAATNTAQQPASTTLGGIVSAVLKDNEAVKRLMTPVEYEAVQAVVRNVGTPDEYSSAMEYVLRALPYVRATYSAMDVVQPIMPTDEEISILMRSRFLEP